MLSPNHQMIPLPSNGLTMVDMFCGAGIGAIGFTLAGFNIVQAFDYKKYAVDTYNRNIHGNHAEIRDIKGTSSSEIKNAHVYTGGFPCTPFSLIGKREGEEDEESGDLGFHFYQKVKDNQPEVFLAENVKGLITKPNLPFFNRLLTAFEDAGYNVAWQLVDCYEYGVPQHRERVFIVGFRKDLSRTFVFPEPIPESERKTIRDAIGDLPEPNGVNNHHGYGLRNDELPFADKIPFGGNWKNLPYEEQVAFMGNAIKGKGGKTGYLRKVSFDKPAHTLTAQMNGKNNAQLVDIRNKYPNNPELWNEPFCRRFTVRECLRLQSVPDWFSFSEDVKLVNQYERTSGIPSLVAYRLGQAITEQLVPLIKSNSN